MNSETKEVLMKFMELCQKHGGRMSNFSPSQAEYEIDWLINEGYLWSPQNPVRTFEGTAYMNIMPTEKAYRWEQAEKDQRQTVEHQAREEEAMAGSKVFIGHGRSDTWRAVKDYMTEELGMEIEEFEQEGVAGLQIKDRLEKMFQNAKWAILVVTADEADRGTPRANVFHEIGYAQGRLGWEQAIVLLEKGCEIPSNINGTIYLPFDRGQVKQVFADLKKRLCGSRP